MFTRNDLLQNFRNERYTLINDARWNHFLSMGIPLAGKTIFEPGAGIGDQTEWLLKQDVKHIHVNDGRPENLQMIQERFNGDPRLTFILGNLENCLLNPEFNFTVDFIFCYGVYYHLNESLSFRIMRGFARLGPTIAFDYHVGNNQVDFYGYDNPSTSMSQYGLRPAEPTMIQALKEIWGYAYVPKKQLVWVDPVAPETRHVLVGSHVPLDNPQLELQ